MVQNSLSQSCKNIARIKGVIENHNNIAIITPYFHNGDLFEYLNSFMSTHKQTQTQTKGGLTEEMVDVFSLQIACGIGHMHNNNIVHRNDNKTCQLIDFDSATLLNTSTNAIAGTQFYLAPELFVKKQEMDKNNEILYSVDESSKAADIWSLGIVFYALLTGKMPWAKATECNFKYNEYSKNGDLNFNGFKSLNSKWKVLISNMLNLNSKERWSIEK
eukprot:Pgem_evm1s5929